MSHVTAMSRPAEYYFVSFQNELSCIDSKLHVTQLQVQFKTQP